MSCYTTVHSRILDSDWSRLIFRNGGSNSSLGYALSSCVRFPLQVLLGKSVYISHSFWVLELIINKRKTRLYFCTSVCVCVSLLSCVSSQRDPPPGRGSGRSRPQKRSAQSERQRKEIRQRPVDRQRPGGRDDVVSPESKRF